MDNFYSIKENAVSEVVGAILLISLVIIGISIVTVMLISNPSPQDIPKASVQIVRDSNLIDTISFYHGGGDPFSYYSTNFSDTVGNLIDRDKIYLNKRNTSTGSLDSSVKWKDNPELMWDYSSVITIFDQTADERKNGYQIQYVGGTGEYLIKEFGDPTYSVVAVPTNPILDLCGIPDASFNCVPGGTYGNEYTCSASDSRHTHSWTFTGKQINTVTKSGNPVTYSFPIPADTNNAGYIVQHTVKNSSLNCSASLNSSVKYYIVGPCSTSPCVAGFSYLIDSSTVYFNADPLVSEIINCSWDFGDGQGVKGLSYLDTSHTYLDGKSIHDVTLTITKERCGQNFPCSVTQQVISEPVVCNCFIDNYDDSTRNPWTVEFYWDPTSACTGLNDKDWKVIFTYGDGNSDTFSHDGIAGITKWPVSNRISHSYTSCRDYSVKMDVIDLHGGIYYTCTHTLNLPCVCSNYPIPNFTATDISSSNLVTLITDSSTPDNIVQWVFDFGDGKPVQTFNLKPDPFAHTYDTCGSYVIKLIVHDAMGCWAETTRSISCGGDNCDPDNTIANFAATSVLTNPKSFTFDDFSNSRNNTLVRWEWDFGDGRTAINTSPPNPFLVDYEECNSYPVKLRVWDDIGCWDDIIKQVSCSCPKPEVRYNYRQSETNPRMYQFNDYSNPVVGLIKERLWEFGDGVRSQEENPSHTYDMEGQYTVRLTVWNDCGSSNDTVFDVINGCPAPTPDFDYRCIAEKVVSFTDLSRVIGDSIDSWYWEFGDAGDNSYSVLPNPTHEYADPGTYLVNLTVRTTCNSQATWSRYITVPCCEIPTSDFTYTCLEDGNTIQFNDTSKSYGDKIIQWSWNFGDGVGANLIPNPLYHYSQPGTYPVNLTITTACGAQNTWLHNITVPCLCSPPIANFSKDMVSTKPFVMRFIDQSVPNSGSITSWNWDFGDGTDFSGQSPPDKSYVSCGEYLVKLRVMNNCGEFDDADQLICCPVFANFSYRMDPVDGYAPVMVYFTDLSDGVPNAWEWNFGDGQTSYLQNPIHTYTNGGNFTVSLHATSSCGGNETHSKILTIGCPEVTADFEYTIVSDDPFNVSFRDQSSGGEIVDWTWFFGDGTTSKEQHPYHQYAGRANYNVWLIVKNSCGNTAQTWRRISYECPNLTADFYVDPSTGTTPLEVQFIDNSTPLEDIVSWLWFFGDGTSYFTTDPTTRNPPNHTYSKLGSYYVTLLIKNECGNPFSIVKMVNATNPARISGYLWNDRNMNKVRDPEESGLAHWPVTLEERIAGTWAEKTGDYTDDNGDYHFDISDVTYGALRVKEALQPRWNVTYSYPSGDETTNSGTLLVSSTRIFENVNFGNVRTNTSTFEFPGYFYTWNPNWGRYDTFSMNETPKYWDFNTSFNWDGQKIYYPNPYVISYTAKGDSSFDVTIGFYARYLIHIQWNNDPPIEYTHWLKYWMYLGDRTDGFTFFVPDNTIITKPDLYFDIDNIRWFELYIPYEGATIPYSTSSYVEAHMTGTGGSTTGCSLIAPVTKQLTWSRSWGYFTGTWDNTPYEGQWVTITAQNDFGTSGSPQYISSSKNVFVDWQPVTPVITSPTDYSVVQGTANIIATVGGHNRDTDNVRLFVDGDDIGQMAYDSLNNLFTYSLNVESYAGKTIDIVVRAYPLPGQGTYKDSNPVHLQVQSTQIIQANFSADPWTGPVPLEVSFTDTSTGGPASWLWNFNDGYGSTEQNPIHIFENEGEFLVSLTVENIQGNPSTIYHYINSTGTLSSVNLLTNRNGYLNPGYASWIVQGTGSKISINSTEYSLNAGDRVKLDIGTTQSNAEIRMTGEITSFNLTDVTLSVNGVPIDTGICSDIHIYDFDNYHSNLKLTVYRQTNSYVNLIWGGSVITVENYHNVEISDIMPSLDKVMELQLESGNIYLDGLASSYRLFS